MYDQQLATEREKYGEHKVLWTFRVQTKLYLAALLQKEMVDRAEHGAAGAPYEQLRSFEDVSEFHTELLVLIDGFFY